MIAAQRVVASGLARFALPPVRPAMRVGAIASAALCAAFFIGPPVDRIAGVIVLVLVIGFAAYAWLAAS